MTTRFPNGTELPHWPTHAICWLVTSCCIASAAPVITRQPESRSAPEGSSITLFVRATGVRAASDYQWQRNKVDLFGQHGTALRLDNLTTNDAGDYRVIATSGDGSRTLSEDARVTVLQRPAPWTYTLLHRFDQPGEPIGPRGRLIRASDGFFYGTSWKGGEDGFGTIFRISLDGEVKVIHSFTGKSDGGEPRGGMIEVEGGWFYGTTSSFGAGGSGTVFRMNRDGAFQTVYAFTGGSDGGQPQSTVTLGADGFLYGTAPVGGRAGGLSASGTFFRLSPEYHIQLLRVFQFNNELGGSPTAPVILASDGRLYGATETGLFVRGNDGVIYGFPEFDRNGGEFSTKNQVPVESRDGSLYGWARISEVGEGLYRLGTNGAPKAIFASRFFLGGGPLVRDDSDRLFGLCLCQNGSFRNGAVVSIATEGVLTPIHGFSTDDGLTDTYYRGEGSLVLASDGSIYGLTPGPGGNGSGAEPSLGSFFVLRPPAASPVVTSHPVSQRVREGNSVTLAVSAQGSGQVHYQWRLEGVDIAGATNTNLVINHITLASAGMYTVSVRNEFGTTVSDAAEIVVPGDSRLFLRPVLVIHDFVGTHYRVEYSDEVDGPAPWHILATVVLDANPYTFVDTTVDGRTWNVPHRLYRAVPLD